MSDPRYEELDCLYSVEKQKEMAGYPFKLILGRLVGLLAAKGGGYLVRMRDGSLMNVSNGVKACQVLLDEYCGVSHDMPNGQPFVLTAPQVKPFVLGDAKLGILPELPVISGSMLVPTTTAFAIRYQGHRLLNTWHDTMLPGDPALLEQPDVQHWLTLLLRMIREALAACPGEYSLDEMLTRLRGREPEDGVFRFIMSWIAAQFQQPGINLQTNLCLLGTNEGCGKGTLGELLRIAMGGSLVLTANSAEFDRGWTDQMYNRLLVCINEIGAKPMKGTRKTETDWAVFAKTYCQEGLITPATRYFGIGNGSIPNFTNWLFTSNSEAPFRISDTDRRMAMFPTSYDRSKNALAQQIQLHLLHNEREPKLLMRVLQGFVAILRGLEVEYELIQKPLDNALRDENMAQHHDPILYWLTDDLTYERDARHPSSYWANRYNDYTNDPAQHLNAQQMYAEMLRLDRRGDVVAIGTPTGRKTAQGKERKRWAFLVSSDNFPVDNDTTAATRQQRLHQLRLMAPAELRH